MPQATLNTLFEKLGEAIAVSREAKHIAAGTSQKVDGVAGKVDQVSGQVNALALVVATQGQLREHVERLEAKVKEQDADLDLLKIDKHRREGAVGLIEWISKNYPFIILVGALAFWVGWANGLLK